MDNHARFFAGDIFEITHPYHDNGLFKTEPGVNEQFVIMKKFPGGEWHHYANIEAISIYKCTAYSLFFNKLNKTKLVFKDLIFIDQEGGKDVEL